MLQMLHVSHGLCVPSPSILPVCNRQHGDQATTMAKLLTGVGRKTLKGLTVIFLQIEASGEKNTLA
jgi:hypothetical protein